MLNFSIKMSVESEIFRKVEGAIQAAHVSIKNESHLHGGPSTESHFNLTVVSDSFITLTRVKRHQLVYELLSQELSEGVHALALHLFTREEWEQGETKALDSPNCLGGSRG